MNKNNFFNDYFADLTVSERNKLIINSYDELVDLRNKFVELDVVPSYEEAHLLLDFMLDIYELVFLSNDKIFDFCGKDNE